MPIDADILAEMVADQIDHLIPTEATFRGATINLRLGEAPQSRTFTLMGVQAAQQMEALMKTADVETEPSNGERVTIGARSYKVVTVTALPSPLSPAFYRLTIARE